MVAVIAVIITLIIGATQSVWFDEAYSITLARSPWRDLFSLTAVDAHPPLYYVLLKIWGSIGGFDELWLRSFSAICLGGTVFLSLLLSRKCFGRRTAIISAPILILAPFMLRYGFEIRMYSLASLIAVGSTLVMLKMIDGSSKRTWIFYGILVAAGMLTMNFMIFVFVAQLIYLIVNYCKTRKARQKTDRIWRQNWFKAFVLSVMIYLPWLPFAEDQIEGGALSGVGTIFGPTQISNILSFLFVYEPEFWLNRLTAFLVIVATGAAVWLIVKLRRDDKKSRNYTFLLLLIFLSPLVIMMILSLVSSKGFFIERYIAHFVWAGYLLVGVAAAKLILNYKKKLVGAAIYLIIIGTFVVGLVNLGRIGNYNFQKMERNRAREIAATINCHEMTVVKDIQLYFSLNYYLGECKNLYFYAPEWTDFSHGYKPLQNSSQWLTEIPENVKVIE